MFDGEGIYIKLQYHSYTLDYFQRKINLKTLNEILHSKYRSIARARCLISGNPSRRETIGSKVMLMTSGDDSTVLNHEA